MVWCISSSRTDLRHHASVLADAVHHTQENLPEVSKTELNRTTQNIKIKQVHAIGNALYLAVLSVADALKDFESVAGNLPLVLAKQRVGVGILVILSRHQRASVSSAVDRHMARAVM